MVLAALPWLLPLHAGIWPSFYAEALAAVSAAAVALAAAARAGVRWRVPWLAVAIAATALLPLVAPGPDTGAGAHRALLPALYLGAFSLALVAGASAPSDRLTDVLLGSLLLAALASAAMVLAQQLGLDAGLWVMKTVTGQRPFANLGQPNNLATLLAWGLASTWWQWQRGRLGAVTSTAVCAVLLVAIVLTGSRTGLLGTLLLAIAAAKGPGDGTRRVGIGWLAVAGAGLLGATLAWPRLASWLAGESVRAATDAGTVDRRFGIWRQMLDALARHPWAGWGWDHIGRAHLAVVDSHPPIYTFVRYSHNVFLDIALWAGLPVALALASALGLWFWRRLRAADDAGTRILLAACGVFMIHAQLELPHAYLYFLIPMGLMMGAVDARLAPPAMVIGRGVYGAGALCALVLAVAAVHDYDAIAAEQFAGRLRAERIANAPAPDPPHPIVLSELQRRLDALATAPRRGMGMDEIARLRDAIDTFPTGGAMMRLAQSLYLAGRPRDARATIERLCRINQPRICEEARVAWAEWLRGDAAAEPSAGAASAP